jgi:hypothetical protein
MDHEDDNKDNDNYEDDASEGDNDVNEDDKVSREADAPPR